MSEIVVNAVSKSWGGVGGVDRISFKAEAGTLLRELGYVSSASA